MRRQLELELFGLVLIVMFLAGAALIVIGGWQYRETVLEMLSEGLRIR